MEIVMLPPCLVGRPPCCGGSCRPQSGQAPDVPSVSSAPLPAPPPSPPPPPSPHQWVWSSRASRWRCAGCFGKRYGEGPPPVGRCPGFPERVRELLRDPKGHKLFIADFSAMDDKFVIVCGLCGCFTTEGRTVGLKLPCPPGGFKSPGARAAWTRVCELKHPSHKLGPAKVLEQAVALDLRSGR